ncbi:MAG TPA: ankyrin repeat domain-containing protein [Burkholderiales bacterium]
MHEDLFAAVEGNDSRWLKELIAEGGDPNSVDQDGNSLLMIAARDGRENALKVLLSTRLKIDARNRLGETALMLAAVEGRTSVAKQLVFNGAQVEFKGWNPMLYAASRGRDEVIELLVNLGANVNTAAPNGVTPLMMAVRGDYRSTVKLLLGKGANPNMKTDRGDTALTWAMDRGHSEIGVTLMEAGAK